MIFYSSIDFKPFFPSEKGDWIGTEMKPVHPTGRL